MRQRIGDRRDRVLALHGARFLRLPPGMHAGVHVRHEGVKMDAALARLDLGGAEEQVHQHGLAAPDLAMDVEAARRGLVGAAPAEQPAERGGFAGEAVFANLVEQALEALGDLALGWIGLDRSVADFGGVEIEQARQGQPSGTASFSTKPTAGRQAPSRGKEAPTENRPK